jgi:hypothetical protein
MYDRGFPAGGQKRVYFKVLSRGTSSRPSPALVVFVVGTENVDTNKIVGRHTNNVNARDVQEDDSRRTLAHNTRAVKECHLVVGNDPWPVDPEIV